MSASAARAAVMLATLLCGLAHGAAMEVARAGDAWTIESLMSRMAELSSARARFTETREMALFSAPLTLTGTLAYERPSKIERIVLTPYQERFAADGDSFTVDRRGRTEARTVVLSSRPLLRAFVESIRATLAGDRSTLVRFYRLSLDGNRMQWTLRLEPAVSELAQYVTLIRITGTDNRLVSIEVEESGGDRSVMTLTDE